MSSNWKAPSATHMQKHDLVPLPEDFEPTPEEQLLLDTYETVKTYERQAARLKEEAARQKLADKEDEFQQKLAPNKKNKRRRRKAAAAAAGGGSESDLGSDDEPSDENDENDEDEDEQTLHERREAKLATWREEVEVAKQPKESEADALRAQQRAQHLTTAAEDAYENVGPLVKRKKMDVQEPKSLIANLNAGATPPHDFSKSLELKRGKVLYPTSTDQGRWTPPEGVISPNDGAFLVELEDFDMSKAQAGSGNNTIAIRFMAPSDSKRFSINIAEPGHDNFNSVLFHFNPRQHEKGGQLVVNDKQEGQWGQAINIPLSQVPLLFGQTACTLIIQLNGDGFDVFLQDKHCARWEHRKELPAESSTLILQFPSTDDYGSPENWSVYKVWWGNREIMAKGDLSNVAGVNIYKALHPRKFFIGGLSKIYAEAEVDLRRAELERAFRKYGGDRGVEVIVPTNTTYAFVEMESERQADLALTEMAGQYRMNRARRSRHEALQEERAAAEAAKKGDVKTNSDWD
jgi:hypothetical protein